MKKVVVMLWAVLAPMLSFAQDLTITEVAGSKTFDRYERIDVTISLVNNGIVDITGGIFTNAYLSSDAQLDANDFNVGTNYLESLAAHAITAPVNESTEGADVPPGTYYLIVKTDYYNRVSETDETNNIYVGSNYVINAPDVDFTLYNFTFPATVATNDYVPVGYKVRNNGTTHVTGSYYTSFYLSNDNVFDSSDPKLNHFYLGFQGEDSLSGLSWNSLAIPSKAPGSYYLIGRADDNYANESDFVETNESNNTAIIPLTIQNGNIDLDFSGSPTFANVISAGMPRLSIHYSLKNTGTTGVIGYTSDVYVSTDQLLDGGDFLLESSYAMTHNSYYVPAGGVSHTSIDILLNANDNRLWGTHYFIVKVNPNAQIPEMDLTDNTTVTGNAITIGPPVSEFMISGANFSRTYTRMDSVLDLFVTFMNVGNASNTFQPYTVSIIDSLGNVVWYQNFQNFSYLFPGMSETVMQRLYLDHPLGVGKYTVNVSGLQIPLEIDPFLVWLSGVIQGEDGTPITKGKLFLYQPQPDGTVKFVQKIVPTTSEKFSLQVASGKQTLYFIPDNSLFPGYIPTILGKTVVLQPSSFINVTKSDTVLFEILKLQSLGSGNKVISGTIDDGSSGSGRVRQVMDVQSLEAIPVILLSESGQVVGLTETNSAGYYKFENLPDGKYQLVVAFELDQGTMEEPIVVDVTLRNAEVNITLSENGVTTDVKEILLSQVITFDELSEVELGTAPFTLTATSTSSLLISFISDTPAVATVTGNVVTIHAPGTTTITATQAGSEIFNPAESVSRTLVVVNGVTAVEKSLERLNVFPNPTRGLLTIIDYRPDHQVSFTDVAGRSEAIQVRDNTLDVSRFQPGLYLLTIKSKGGVKIIKVIRE